MSYYDAPQSPSSSGGGKSTLVIIIVVLGVCLVATVLCVGILAALLLPAVQAAREAARSAMSQNNMKQIALALHNYESTYKSLPPRVTYDADGQPLYSWRVNILPFLEQQAVYQSFDLNQAWDSPTNSAMSSVTIPTYVSPSDPSAPASTSYFAIEDPQAALTDSGTKFSDFTDGISRTVFIFESHNRNIPWAAPDDLSLAEFEATLNAGATRRGTNVAFADGACSVIPAGTGPQESKSMMTRDGND